MLKVYGAQDVPTDGGAYAGIRKGDIIKMWVVQKLPAGRTEFAGTS